VEEVVVVEERSWIKDVGWLASRLRGLFVVFVTARDRVRGLVVLGDLPRRVECPGQLCK
jgi:hypothetical protein